MTDEAIPVGERLGSERLYGEYDEKQAPPPPVQLLNSAALGKPRGKPRRERAAKPAPVPVKDSAAQPESVDRNWRAIISTLLELIGIAAVTAGCWGIEWYVGAIVGGILVVLLGVALGLEVTA